MVIEWQWIVCAYYAHCHYHYACVIMRRIITKAYYSFLNVFLVRRTVLCKFVLLISFHCKSSDDNISLEISDETLTHSHSNQTRTRNMYYVCVFCWLFISYKMQHLPLMLRAEFHYIVTNHPRGKNRVCRWTERKRSDPIKKLPRELGPAFEGV